MGEIKFMMMKRIEMTWWLYPSDSFAHLKDPHSLVKPQFKCAIVDQHLLLDQIHQENSFDNVLDYPKAWIATTTYTYIWELSMLKVKLTHICICNCIERQDCGDSAPMNVYTKPKPKKIRTKLNRRNCDYI